MALKIYSDVTKQFYENEDAARKAEDKELEARNARGAKRKQMAERVEQTRKALADAKKAHDEALAEFCKEFGAYHYTISSDDLTKQMNQVLKDLFDCC